MNPQKSNRGRKRRYCSTDDSVSISKVTERDENVNSGRSVITPSSNLDTAYRSDNYCNIKVANVYSLNSDEIINIDSSDEVINIDSSDEIINIDPSEGVLNVSSSENVINIGSSNGDIGMATHYNEIKMEKINLCDEEVQMPTNPAMCKTKLPSKSTQRVRFYVEATYSEHSSSKYELTNLICQPFPDQTSQRDSLSSGYLADGSKTGSPTSTASSNLIQQQVALHLTRMSYASTASSASNIPTSAAALVTQSTKKSCVHKDTINKLKKKWKNSDLVYSLLERLDQLLGDGQIPHNTNNVPIRTTRKRSGTNDKEDKKKKLKSSATMPTLNEIQGQKVFARWKNRKFYFGHILETLHDNRVKIEYLDKSSHVVNQDHIITDFTSLIGNTAMVSKDGHGYYPGIITSFDVENGAFKYMVATNNGDFPVDVNNIYITEPQAKSMQENQPNVPLSEYSYYDDFPSCSGTQLAKSNMSATTNTDSSDSKLSDEGDYVFGCDIETNQPQNLNNSLKLKNLRGKVPKRTNKNEDLLLGPLDVQGEWFKGYNFLITCSDSPASKPEEEAHTDSEDFPFSTIPFIYDRLVQQIKLGKGRIVQALEDVQASDYSKTYLITNRPCLTPKYLQCLAFGIKILCHQWIVACTIKRELAPLQELPAGWSIERSCFINMFDRNTSLPLSNLSISVAQYDNPNFSKFWVHICNALGATTTTFVGTFENTDLIVVEDGMHCPKLRAAYCFGVPLVSSSWIVQTIIHGEARSYTGHPSYNYLLEESSN